MVDKIKSTLEPTRLIAIRFVPTCRTTEHAGCCGPAEQPAPCRGSRRSEQPRPPAAGQPSSRRFRRSEPPRTPADGTQ